MGTLHTELQLLPRHAPNPSPSGQVRKNSLQKASISHTKEIITIPFATLGQSLEFVLYCLLLKCKKKSFKQTHYIGGWKTPLRQVLLLTPVTLKSFCLTSSWNLEKIKCPILPFQHHFQPFFQAEPLTCQFLSSAYNRWDGERNKTVLSTMAKPAWGTIPHQYPLSFIFECIC